MTERTGQLPDSADAEGLRLAVSQQGIMLGRQVDALSQMSAAQQELFHRLDNITQTLHELTDQFSHAAPQATVDLTPSAPGPSSTSENIRLQPEPFLGDVETCGGFLLQCQLIFQQAPRYYQTDHSKITLIINSLRNRRLHWAQAFLAANPITHLTYDRFLSEFRLIFDQPRKWEEVTRRLLELKQRNRPVSDHVIDFRILAVEAGWPDVALKGIFYQSLNKHIKDHLCSQPEARSFEELVSAALRSDVRLREHQKERPHTLHRSTANVFSTLAAKSATRSEPPASNKPPDEPMQIGHSKLTEEERRKRREEGACFYCGAQGHLVSSCPRRLNYRTPPLSDRPRGGGTTTISSGKDFLFIPVKLCFNLHVHDSHALVDSGAEQSLIDQHLVNQLSIPTELLDIPIEASGLGGQHLSRITHRTKPILLVSSGNHRESIQLLITQSPRTPIVLGFSWLKLHNPQFNWSQSTVTKWSSYCLANCLLSAIPAVSVSCVDYSSQVDLSKIPHCYHDLKTVFCKTKASALPPHRPYDCAINLLPGASLPKGRLFNLSGPERAAMEEYIREALSLGHIRPSSSPVGAGFFFVEKKDKTLRPRIDYRELNQITVKDKYSLPLITSVFYSVQKAHIFTKLDLRNAYHLVRIKDGDEWKTAFNTPWGHYDLLPVSRFSQSRVVACPAAFWKPLSVFFPWSRREPLPLLLPSRAVTFAIATRTYPPVTPQNSITSLWTLRSLLPSLLLQY
uniref:ribonuclease H n=1 Tax=Oryzias latipes TaxID=8090 RepID=A0A3P9HSQ5_ORYLA